MDLRLVVACGALSCDSNHNDGAEKLCISYEGAATSANRWALTGEVRLKGQHADVPPIMFQSAKLAELFSKELGGANSSVIVNMFELRKAVLGVLKLYTSHGVKWDMVLWCKFTASGGV